MKIFEIYNENLKETFYVHSLYEFCKFNGLTERLLRYTHPKLKLLHYEDKNVRWQPYHKGFKIVNEFNDDRIIKSEKGKHNVYYVIDLGEYYYIPYEEQLEDAIKKAMKEQKKQADTNSSKETYDFSSLGQDNDKNYEDDLLVKKYQSSLKTIQKLRDENTLL